MPPRLHVDEGSFDAAAPTLPVGAAAPHAVDPLSEHEIKKEKHVWI